MIDIFLILIIFIQCVIIIFVMRVLLCILVCLSYMSMMILLGLDFIELNLNFFNLQDYLNKNDISEFAKNIIITSLFIF